MEQEHSQLLYEQYILNYDKKVILVLRNGRRLKGFIVGWFKDDEDEPVINKWHIVEEEYRPCLGMDAFGYIAGELIHHADIVSYHFEDH